MENSKKKITIVIYNHDVKACKKTCENIRKQSLYQQQQIQLFVVWSLALQSNATFEKYLEENQIVCIKEELENNQQVTVMQQVFELVKGQLLHFTKAGTTYADGNLQKIFSAYENSGHSLLVSMIETEGYTAEMRELNAFQRDLGIAADLENNFHLVHDSYAAYFVEAEMAKQFLPDTSDWMLSVLYVLFAVSVQKKEITYCSDCLVKVPSGQFLVGEWQGYIKDGDFDKIWNGLLEPMLKFAKANPHICMKNAKYNLLFYCSKIRNFLIESDVARLEQIREKMDQVIAFIKDEEVLLFNQYFTRSYKHHFLTQFDWETNEQVEVQKRKADMLDASYAANQIIFVECDHEQGVVEGSTALYGSDAFEVQLEVNGKRFDCELSKKELEESWFGKTISHAQYYRCEVSLNAGTHYQIQVICKKAGQEVKKKVMTFSNYTPLSNEIFLYGRKAGWLMFAEADKGVLHFKPDRFGTHVALFWKRLADLITYNGASRKAIIARGVYQIRKALKRKQIWLVSDRTNRADDNGECFFQYMCENPQPDVEVYYVIEKDCPDYERMSKIGNVIPVYSWQHKMMHLLSDYVISSQANKAVINPFGRIGQYYRDIIGEKPIVFLQHGVIKDDLSDWLNRYNRNLYGFVTTTRAEYQSILDYDYYYSSREVWLTGLPRHDRLYHDEKNYITIMPTWRKTLTGGTDAAGVWQVGANFPQSSYFKFYNTLLNDERLLNAAKERGYQICFFPHPNVKPALPLFTHHPEVAFWNEEKTYREVYAQSDLIVTDYSSAVFDFAYLRKPIIYAQFDRDEFFAGGHSYVEGYYNYQTDGFGEVEENLDATVDRIIEYMEQGCQLKPRYQKRIDDTFAYADKNCSQRVYEKIRNRAIRFAAENK